MRSVKGKVLTKSARRKERKELETGIIKTEAHTKKVSSAGRQEG